jgi:hypothetical protein
MSSQLSRLLSLDRLRTYEDECRRQAETSSDLFARSELTKLADTFRQAIKDIEASLRFSDTERAGPQLAWAGARRRRDELVES